MVGARVGGDTVEQREQLPGRTGLELLQDQLDGLSSWHRDRARRLLAAEASQATREQRLDTRHRMDAIRRAHAALLARADQSIEESRELLGPAQITGLLANRSEWMRHKLALGLEELGLMVVADVDDGADALGVAVIEQPDVLILEDRLPSMTGIEVVRAVAQDADRGAGGGPEQRAGDAGGGRHRHLQQADPAAAGRGAGRRAADSAPTR